MEETWKPVRGYESGYEVSSIGRVRTVKTEPRRGAKDGRVRKLTNHACGYLAVTLYKDNHANTFLVHRLVAGAFIGDLFEGLEVNHLDGNKKNNCVDNLELVSRQQNIDHAVATGLIANKGERNSQTSLSAAQVAAIRSRYTAGGRSNGGKGYKALAHEYGVAWGTIRQIIKRRTWRHIA